MTKEEARSDRKQSKREQLIAASVEVFSQRGFHAAKMQDIADAASVGKGTLYEYFQTKDELFLAVYRQWMDEYEHAMNSAANSALEPVAAADALIDTTIDFYERHADHASLLLEFWAHALRSDDRQFIERIREMKKKLAELGASLTQRLIRLKAFHDVDVQSFARLELGISDGIFLQWVLDGKSYSLRDAYKFRQSVIGAGLMSPTLRRLLSAKTKKRLHQGFLATKSS